MAVIVAVADEVVAVGAVVAGVERCPEMQCGLSLEVRKSVNCFNAGVSLKFNNHFPTRHPPVWWRANQHVQAQVHAGILEPRIVSLPHHMSA